MMPYLHIHDGEEVVYEEVCPVCPGIDDILNIGRIQVADLDA